MQNFQQKFSRRAFLKAAGLGALGTVMTGGLTSGLLQGFSAPAAHAATVSLSLIATDGYITVPGRETNPLYIFGFVPVSSSLTIAQLSAQYKGYAKHTAPTLDFNQEDDIKITLTNLGLVQRPDLVDSHTIHWHGFDVPSPLNDGVPEVSVAVPIGKQVTYFYRPHREGTYMYHCHFEDVEHVQMGMTGVVFVRPSQDGTSHGGFTKFAYNDGDGSTGYNRHFAILMNELWGEVHDADRDIQEVIETSYDPNWFTLNGRCYPQTTLPNDDPTVSPASVSGITTLQPNYNQTYASQPNSSLIQVNAGERALLRLANLGYKQNAMQLPGIPMHVVGQDASWLRKGGVDATYWTNTLFIGPGEARDVLFDAPAYDAARPSGTDARGAYNVYYFKNRDWRKLSNNGNPGNASFGLPGGGGMMTEVRVYPGTLPAQSKVSQTFA